VLLILIWAIVATVYATATTVPFIFPPPPVNDTEPEPEPEPEIVPEEPIGEPIVDFSIFLTDYSF